MTHGLDGGLVCPTPLTEGERIQLGHGSGGRLSQRLLEEHFLPAFGNPHLNTLGDGTLVPVVGSEIVLSTDSFVVSPLEFPGGNIGHLAVHGTLNDLAMMGAEPRFLTTGFILEEGLPLEVLDRVLAAMTEATREAGVAIVTGDTKVVEAGKADGLFINTTGVGFVRPEFRPAPDQARPGDRILVSGPIGAHGITILEARGDLGFRTELETDSASLHALVGKLAGLGDQVRVLRDPTRGGVASALNEVATTSKVGMRIQDGSVPIPTPVKGACEMLGLDPMYVANEGVMVLVVDPDSEEEALEILRGDPLGAQACRIGEVVAERPGLVTLRTGLGTSRILDVLPGDQLPRIC